MSVLGFDGIEVRFPFAPYEAQTEYMEKVIEALSRKENALLESPTGTGKTLCLLCSTIAWALSKREQHPFKQSQKFTFKTQRDGNKPSLKGFKPFRIVYCSRTHAQLSQVIRELKRTVYGSMVSMALLGSRDYMCINSQVNALPTSHSQQIKCNLLRTEKACRYYNGMRREGELGFLSTQTIHDMEDIAREGRRETFCPYFYERERAKDADIVFAPYNYIFDSTLRKQLPFDLEENILIIDEGHNLPSALSTSGCANLLPVELASAISDCTRAVAFNRLEAETREKFTEKDQMTEQDLASLKIMLCRLEEHIAQEAISEQGKVPASLANETSEHVFRGSEIYSLLAKAYLTKEIFDGTPFKVGVNELISRTIALLASSEKPAIGLPKVQEFFSSVFSYMESSEDEESVKFVVLDEKDTKDDRVPKRIIGFWRLDNSSALTEITKTLYSFILTSGTLSPIDHFAVELGIPFGVRLKGRHVIKPTQVVSTILCKGPGGEKLNGSYAFRSSENYRVGLGMALVNLIRNTPGGILVFFPSYFAMDSAITLWKSGLKSNTGGGKTIWTLLSETKRVYVEPRESVGLQSVVSSFQKSVDESSSKGGAVLFAVCRGKVSEGIDFSDNHGRCVVVTGIPFANHTDLFVRLKREYLTAVAPRRPKVHGRPFTGDDWYRNEAMRAVNQCIGRVIRHKDDYGAIVLADERFADQIDNLADWIAKRTVTHREYRETFSTLNHFFAQYKNHNAQHNPLAVSMDLSSDSHSSSSEVLNTLALPVSSDIANLAKEYALKLEQSRHLTQQQLMEEKLKMAAEKPVQVRAPIQKEAAIHTADATALPVTNAIVIPTMETSTYMPKMQKQQVEIASIAAHSSSPFGTTSKEFCSYLKSRLSTDLFDNFKSKLQAIAKLRLEVARNPDKVDTVFKKIVAEMCNLFRAADEGNFDDITAEFGQYLPEEFRPLYARTIWGMKNSQS